MFQSTGTFMLKAVLRQVNLRVVCVGELIAEPGGTVTCWELFSMVQIIMAGGDVIAITASEKEMDARRYNKARAKGLGDQEGKDQKFLEV